MLYDFSNACILLSWKGVRSPYMVNLDNGMCELSRLL